MQINQQVRSRSVESSTPAGKFESLDGPLGMPARVLHDRQRRRVGGRARRERANGSHGLRTLAVAHAAQASTVKASLRV